MKNPIFDIHCHIIPGVDDGADSMETSLKILQKEYDDGVRGIILTPHFRQRMFETPGEIIKKRFAVLRDAAGQYFPDLSLYLGCEFHANMEMTEIIAADRRFTMAGSDFVLTEFSERHEASFIRERLYALRTDGYIPIIAHAERYEPVRRDLDFLDELIDMGCRVQVNADSILGYEGRPAKKFCRQLMKYDMLHFVGTDAHNMTDRPARMGECARLMEKKMGADYTERILSENPMEILRNARASGEISE